MSMTAANFPAGNVVQVVDTLDVERNVLCRLDRRQIAARVGDAAEFHDSGGLDAHRDPLC